MKIIIYALLFFSFYGSQKMNAQWAYTFSNAIIEAGVNHATTSVTSATNQTTFGIRFGITSGTYTIHVNKVDTDWDSGLVLSVRRSGNGTGSGTISGGTTFTTVTNAMQPFFTGTMPAYGTRSNITIQYQISNISVVVPAKTHSTTVIYTITN
jgi:hypothetical protein